MSDQVVTFTIENKDTSQLTVLIIGDLLPVRHQATGYRISDGFLFILVGERVIATYNRDKWIAIRE